MYWYNILVSLLFWVYILKNITDPSTYLQESTVRAEILETKQIIKLDYEISCNEDFLGRNPTQTYDISRHPSPVQSKKSYIEHFIYVNCFDMGFFMSNK